MESNALLNDIFLTAAELFALAALFGGLAFVLVRLVRLAGRLPFAARIDIARAQRLLSGGPLLLFLLSAVALLVFNGSIMIQGRGMGVATSDGLQPPRADC